MNAKLTLAALALATCTFAVAQDVPPAPPSAPRAPRAARAPRAPEVHIISNESDLMHMGMGGKWWADPTLATRLGLSADQQKRMEDIFQQTRIQLIDLHANLEKQEIQMEPLLAANPPDTNKVLAQIDHTAQARADLEKAHAKMLLGIRGVLTAEQWTKLQAEQHSHPRTMNFRLGEGAGHGEGMGHEEGLPVVRERREVHVVRHPDGTTTTTTSGGPNGETEFEVVPTPRP